jgi:lysophospholipid acyltransferase (LPLAT)-like uncharacterized protein
MLRTRVLPYTLFLFYSVLKFTWRIRVVESASFQAALKDGRPMVFAHWHGDIPAILYLLKRYRAAAIISQSKDGDLVDFVARLLGGKTARGSSHRGGAAGLKGMLRLCRDGYRPSVAVDGPKGPRHKVKPGVLEISRVISGGLYPLTVACDRRWVFPKAWDKAFLPKPFAKIVVVWGDEVPAVARTEDSRDPQLAERLEVAMTNAGQQARKLVAAKSV